MAYEHAHNLAQLEPGAEGRDDDARGVSNAPEKLGWVGC